MSSAPQTSSAAAQIDQRATLLHIHWRGFTSFLVTLGFLVLTGSGIILYIAPYGRVAHWTDWRFAGLEKEQWSAVHISAALLFLASAGFHLYFNWKPLVHYIRTARGFNLRKEMVLAIAIIACLLIGTVQEWPVFTYPTVVNDRVKVFWDFRSSPAPYPHAELSTLDKFAAHFGFPMESLLIRLEELGVTNPTASMTVGDAAEQLKVPPSRLLRLINLPFHRPAPAGALSEKP